MPLLGDLFFDGSVGDLVHVGGLNRLLGRHLGCDALH